MRLVSVAIIALVAAFLLIMGCSGSPSQPSAAASGANSQANGAPSNAFTTDATTPNAAGQQISSLPAAHVNEAYFGDIYPTAGTPPYTCYLAPGSSLPGQLAFGGNSCEIAGMPPDLSPGSTHAAYSFSFMIKDADGVEYGPYPLTLEVVPYPPDFMMMNYPEPAQIGVPYSHDFCHPASDTPLNCGHTPPSDDPSNGVPPYTFTASNLPLGLTMRSDGHLSGTIPKGATTGRQQFEVCAADSTGTTACQNASIDIKPPAEKWSGTLTGDYANDPNSDYVAAGASWSYKCTLEFYLPTSFVSMSKSENVQIEYGNGTAGCTTTIKSQSKFGYDSGLKFAGGSIDNVPAEITAFAGGTGQPMIDAEAVPSSANFVGGSTTNYYRDTGKAYSQYSFFAPKLALQVTSVTDSTISGTWMFQDVYGGQDSNVIAQHATFTLNKVE